MPEMLTVRDMTVAFGGVKALDGLSFSVANGEIHGIIGPNGAGKTTAINAMTGFVPVSSGEILFNDAPLPKTSRGIALLGITRTFQGPATFPALTAVENVMTGGYSHPVIGMLRDVLLTKAARMERAKQRDAAAQLLERVNFGHPIDTPVDELAFGEHRKVEIARALMFRPRLLLLDEPTAGLTEEEVQSVSSLLRQVVNESREPFSIVLVEHNVPLVFSLSDTVTAFDQGRVIASGMPAEVRSTPSVVESYLGGHTPDEKPEEAAQDEIRVISETTQTRASEATLVVSNLEAGYGSVSVLQEVSMTVQPGELVLIYGRNGAGKSTLLNAIAGFPRPSKGEVILGTRRLHRLTVSQIVRAGLGLVPQERGVIASLTVEDNLGLGTVGLRLSRAEYRQRVEELYGRFPALSARSKQLAGTLSGGERQMLALAKVLIRRPQVLLLDEPSIGLAPTIVENLRAVVQNIREEGISVVVAEQNVWWVAPLASRAYLLEGGVLREEGPVAEIIKRDVLIASYLGDEI